jgi:DNA-binding NarL/FixJ family response regulator
VRGQWHDAAVTATVLVVDDHPTFRLFARRLARAAGFAVVGEAADGASALAAARALRPDVVLLDVLLPDTTGFELAELLAAYPAAPCVVLTSSRSASEYRAALAGSSAHAFISKADLTVAGFAALVGTP